VAQIPETMDPDFAAQFRSIQLHFIAGLPQRLDEIRSAADSRQRYVALHRLAGAAGGYGFPSLGDMARDAMQAMDTNSGSMLDASLQKLALALEAIVIADEN